MTASDATPFPVKNQAYRVTFPILDADGDLVTSAAGLDSEGSKDAGTFADVTAEATEIATASGMYYLDLTATEMNADTVAIIVKTTTTGAKTTPIVLYPAESTDIPVNVTAIGGVAQSATDLKDFADTGYDPANHKSQSDLIYIHGTALTETDGQLAAAFKKLFDVATPLLMASDDIPTVTEFNARTLPSADYVVTSDTIAGVTTATNLTNAPTSGDLTTAMKTSVNDQVVDVMKTDTTAEMSQGAPPATPTFEDMVAYIYFKLRNKGLTTATEDAMYADDGTTKIMKATLSDNGTTFEKSEYVSGA